MVGAIGRCLKLLIGTFFIFFCKKKLLYKTFLKFIIIFCGIRKVNRNISKKNLDYGKKTLEKKKDSYKINENNHI